MLQEHYVVEFFEGANSWEKRQAVHRALDVLKKNGEKKGSELAVLLRSVRVPIDIAVTIFMALGYFAMTQPTREKGTRALHVSDERVSFSKEKRELARLHKDHGPFGASVPVIPWEIA
ncbi:MAG: hypothetical protein U1D31_00910 [Patescibacteria group bacterium]|nr:hypothetical protein [bacterium]MDZ4240680.1 hypothetical protein [Patescibacteria group bacterium]